MRMNFALKAALAGVVLNILLSMVVPALPTFGIGLLDEVAGMFAMHGETLLSSSVVVGLSVYLSVLLAKRI